PLKRKERIFSEAKRLSESVGGSIAPSERFLDKVAFLNEKPRAFLGKIDERFLSLPREVIATAMEEQLNLFSITDGAGKLLPYFVGVRDGGDIGMENVVEGYEQVLKARLADAHFFFYEDLKVPLRERISGLSGIIFLRGLGTIADKVRRMKHILVLLPVEESVKGKALLAAEL
ncbi:MAG: glycine--tRNA ligase subunit beta, partial [Chloroflexi bacterium]|nr:glycine--tRNA ligase subunit beta [Chloroflexota bacterium]